MTLSQTPFAGTKTYIVPETIPSKKSFPDKIKSLFKKNLPIDTGWKSIKIKSHFPTDYVASDGVLTIDTPVSQAERNHDVSVIQTTFFDDLTHRVKAREFEKRDPLVFKPYVKTILYGDYEITGDLPEHTLLTVIGHVKISGNVKQGAHIEANSIEINENADANSVLTSTQGSIIIHGYANDPVTCDSAKDILIEKGAYDNLKATALHGKIDIKEQVGEKTKLKAKEIHVHTVGYESNLISTEGDIIITGNIADKGTLTSARNLFCHSARSELLANAIGKATFEHIGANGNIIAGEIWVGKGDDQNEHIKVTGGSIGFNSILKATQKNIYAGECYNNVTLNAEKGSIYCMKAGNILKATSERSGYYQNVGSLATIIAKKGDITIGSIESGKVKAEEGNVKILKSKGNATIAVGPSHHIFYELFNQPRER